jgi:hypothetical protein
VLAIQSLRNTGFLREVQREVLLINSTGVLQNLERNVTLDLIPLQYRPCFASEKWVAMTTRFNGRLRSTDLGSCPGTFPGIVNGPAPPISRGKVDTSTFSNALRNIVLGAFLFYCLLPATWIITAMSKDIGQLFSTFGL